MNPLEGAAVILLGALVFAIFMLISRVDDVRRQITPFLNSSIGQAIARS